MDSMFTTTEIITTIALFIGVAIAIGKYEYQKHNH